jgi:hypothetical protein
LISPRSYGSQDRDLSRSMDVSADMIHALPYLITILGTSKLTVGVIEGIAQAANTGHHPYSAAWTTGALRRGLRSCLPWGSFHGPCRPKAAITLSRKDWHSAANRAVL